jgi:multiple sugar transport system permease protein
MASVRDRAPSLAPRVRPRPGVDGAAGYGFALFRGAGVALGRVLLAFMIPFQAVLTPLFLEMHDLHLLNSLLGLALFYPTFNLPVALSNVENGT